MKKSDEDKKKDDQQIKKDVSENPMKEKHKPEDDEDPDYHFLLEDHYNN
jgi:hypothetical protein